MIDCRKCNFSVSPTMRHALTENCCPACGSSLLGDVHIGRLNLFRQKVINQEFASGLKSDVIFDIALFMLMEFSPPSPPSTVEAPVEGEDSEGDSDPAAEKDTLGPGSHLSDEISSYDTLRDQIRLDAEGRLSAVTDEDLDSDLKIQRLKRLAKDASSKASRTIVRRIER